MVQIKDYRIIISSSLKKLFYFYKIYFVKLLICITFIFLCGCSLLVNALNDHLRERRYKNLHMLENVHGVSFIPDKKKSHDLMIDYFSLNCEKINEYISSLKDPDNFIQNSGAYCPSHDNKCYLFFLDQNNENYFMSYYNKTEKKYYKTYSLVKNPYGMKAVYNRHPIEHELPFIHIDNVIITERKADDIQSCNMLITQDQKEIFKEFLERNNYGTE